MTFREVSGGSLGMDPDYQGIFKKSVFRKDVFTLLGKDFYILLDRFASHSNCFIRCFSIRDAPWKNRDSYCISPFRLFAKENFISAFGYGSPHTVREIPVSLHCT